MRLLSVAEVDMTGLEAGGFVLIVLSASDTVFLEGGPSGMHLHVYHRDDHGGVIVLFPLCVL